MPTPPTTPSLSANMPAMSLVNPMQNLIESPSLSLLSKSLTVPAPYAAKARALLKPWHPFLFFDLAQMEDDLVFQMGFRDLFCRDVWIHDVFKQDGICSAWPVEAFPADPAGEFQRFEGHVFRCLTQMLAKALNHDQPMLNQILLAPDGLLNWEAVIRYLGILTAPLAPWFNLTPLRDDTFLGVWAGQPMAETEGGKMVPGWFFRDKGDIRPWHRVEDFALCLIEAGDFSRECRELFYQGGQELVEKLFRKAILERVANAIYAMKFEV